MLEKLEYIKGVIGSRNRRRKENTMTKRKTTKEQKKHYTENKKSSNKKPTKNWSELSTCGTPRGTLATNRAMSQCEK
jgi:hypothetical protein